MKFGVKRNCSSLAERRDQDEIPVIKNILTQIARIFVIETKNSMNRVLIYIFPVPTVPTVVS